MVFKKMDNMQNPTKWRIHKLFLIKLLFTYIKSLLWDENFDFETKNSKDSLTKAKLLSGSFF